MNRVSVSAVVATYNRAHLLPRLVDALAAQRDAPPFEVVIVDNGSSDQTSQTLEALAARTDVAVRSVRLHPNRGPGPARNAGWRCARGELIAFVDDDCVPDPAWLAHLAGRLAEVDLVQGRTLPHPQQLHHRGWFDHHVEVTHDRRFYETCNIGYRREVLERLGGFAERYQARGQRPSMYGDDTDLGWRALEAGARYAFEPEALVWHDVRPGGLRDRLGDLPRREGVVLAVRQHPGLRHHLESRWFYKRSHPPALLATAGLAQLAARPTSGNRWVAATVLAAPWLAYHGRRVARREWASVLPRLFVVDVVETAVLARGSLRHRTLLL